MKNGYTDGTPVLRTAQAPNGLYVQEETFTIAASTANSGSFTVRKGRGDVQAYQITVASDGATQNELQKSSVTISPDGKSSGEKMNLNRLSSNYRFEKSTIIPQFMRGASTIDYSINNVDNANELVVSIALFFYSPVQQLDVAEEIDLNC